MKHRPRTKADIPAFASEAEEAEYWASADTSALVDTLEEVERPARRRALATMSVRLRDVDIDRLAAVAATRGVGPTQLIREWVLERLVEEEAAEGVGSEERVYELLERHVEVVRTAVADLRRRSER